MLDNAECAEKYAALTKKAEKLKSFRAALYEQTVVRTIDKKVHTYDSFLKQYQLLIKKPSDAIKKEQHSSMLKVHSPAPERSVG